MEQDEGHPLRRQSTGSCAVPGGESQGPMVAERSERGSVRAPLRWREGGPAIFDNARKEDAKRMQEDAKRMHLTSRP